MKNLCLVTLLSKRRPSIPGEQCTAEPRPTEVEDYLCGVPTRYLIFALPFSYWLGEDCVKFGEFTQTGLNFVSECIKNCRNATLMKVIVHTGFTIFFKHFTERIRKSNSVKILNVICNG